MITKTTIVSRVPDAINARFEKKGKSFVKNIPTLETRKIFLHILLLALKFNYLTAAGLCPTAMDDCDEKTTESFKTKCGKLLMKLF